MSIFDPKPFLNSKFAQDITYYQIDGDPSGITCKAIVEFKDRKAKSERRVDFTQVFYPIRITLSKDDVDAITINKDTISIHKDYQGRGRVVSVKEVSIESNEKTWVLGSS